MSIGGSTTGITFGGLSSGIDTEGIITRLIDLQKAPINRIQRQQAILSAKTATYGNLQTKISGVAQAASALNISGSFNPMNSSTSDSAVATISSTSSSTPGSFSLTVSKLAANQKVASLAQTSISDPLSLSGSFVVNGKAVSVSATDSLKTIASSINGLQAGVSASVIDGGAGNSFLTITSNTIGASGSIQFSDLSGSVLSSLGMTTGATSIRSAITNGAVGTKFSSSASSVQSLLGTTGLASQSVTINGTSVALDLSTDTLQGVADKINAAGTGATATVKTVTDGASSTFRLSITGATTPTFADSGNTLQALGILQRSAGNQLVAAQDASFTLDGVALTSASNTVTTVIPGATIVLNKANLTTPEKATLSITKDSAGVKSKINDLVSAYNDAIGFVSDNSKFDTKTFSAGPLFGDSVASQFESSITSLLFSDVAGTTGTYKNLAAIGFGLDKDGKIEVDDTQFDKALADKPEEVRKLFQSNGSSSNTDITYVSSTSKTKASGTSGHAVNITQVATKGSFVAGDAQTLPSTTSEILTFGGAMFGTGGTTLTLDIGSTLTSTVSKINSDSRLKDYVTASIDGGKLRLDSKRFGAAGVYTFVSNQSPTGSNSGVGAGGTGTMVNGLDVAGTIGLQLATGYGQFLTGAGPDPVTKAIRNTVAEGLQIQYTGATTGSVGSVNFSQGMGTLFSSAISVFTDGTNGLIAANQNAIQSQIDTLDEQITRIQASATDKSNELRSRFAAMEASISAAQAQGNQLRAINTTSNR